MLLTHRNPLQTYYMTSQKCYYDVRTPSSGQKICLVDALSPSQCMKTCSSDIQHVATLHDCMTTKLNVMPFQHIAMAAKHIHTTLKQVWITLNSTIWHGIHTCDTHSHSFSLHISYNDSQFSSFMVLLALYNIQKSSHYTNTPPYGIPTFCHEHQNHSRPVTMLSIHVNMASNPLHVACKHVFLTSWPFQYAYNADYMFVWHIYPCIWNHNILWPLNPFLCPFIRHQNMFGWQYTRPYGINYTWSWYVTLYVISSIWHSWYVDMTYKSSQTKSNELQTC